MQIKFIFISIISFLFAQENITISLHVVDLLDLSVPNTIVTLSGGEGIIDQDTSSGDGWVILEIPVVSIGEDTPVPFTLSLDQNYPNPWNPTTSIQFSTLEPGRFSIYNILGQEIVSSSIKEPGQYNAIWGGLNKQNKPVSAGVYIYTLQTEKIRLTKKMILLDGGNTHGLSVSHLGRYPTKQSKVMTTYDISFTGSHIAEETIQLDILSDTTYVNNVNVKPYFFSDIPDDSMYYQDTLIIELYDYAYNDNNTNIFIDGSPCVWGSANHEIIFRNCDPGSYNITVYISDIFGDWQDSTFFILEVYAFAPNVSNVFINPDEPAIGDSLFLTYTFTDPDSGLDMSIKQWYKNGQLTGVEGLIFPPDSASAGDSVKVTVTAYDGEVTGNTEESNTVAYPMPPDTSRDISGTILEFFSELPDSGAMIITSLDTAVTDVSGNYTVEASFNREDVLVLKDGRFESGFIVGNGEDDVIYDHEIAKDDSSGGIDRWLFENYILNRLNSPEELNGIYMSLTEESVPDTAWILGQIMIGTNTYSQGFMNVAQLNKLAEKINITAGELTNGLYGEDRTVIMIADSNFTNPDSTALFAYSNMQAVDNDDAPIYEYDRISRTMMIRPHLTVQGGNTTAFEDDGVTIRGHELILRYNLTPNTLGGNFDTEFASSALGGVETPSGFPSVLSPTGGTITEHDLRIYDMIIDRGPGHMFPDFPADFNLEVARNYTTNATPIPQFSAPNTSIGK